MINIAKFYLFCLKINSGTAVQVIVAENDRFVIKEEELGKILLDPRIKESHVIVVSIAGAYRTGKSFILNFFLRYLQSKVSVPCQSSQWRSYARRGEAAALGREATESVTE